jgi:FtsP/CotA-like multicopper oxidase with cupredoxin domain
MIATDHLDRVHLRSYRDARQPTPPKVPANDPSCPGTPGKPDIPHCFNQTNLHSHGLWVSPAGNSDNVLVNVGARREFPI